MSINDNLESSAERATAHDAEDDPRNEHLLIYVNGELVPRQQAVVSVYDSGFMLGDGMWEGLRLYNGRWAFLEEHLDRLYGSCKAVDLDIGLSRQEMVSALEKTAQANKMITDVHCRLMVTRGVKIKPFQHPSLSRTGPTIVIIMEHSKPLSTMQIKGMSLATVPQVRGLPMSQDAKYNSHSKLNCVIACLQAEHAGADEALMLDPHGFVNTTNSCNFFIVRTGEVWTSTGDYCMNGVTRQKIIDLCKTHQVPVYERNYSLFDTYSADEAFMTGTFGAQTPVTMIDNKPIGNAEGAGPLTLQLRQWYKELVAENTAA
ncbi:MAG: aminotransferase class IV [Gammaproteobacteria bacterium]|nr:aminotransferase class IV [Gammaproteobacteria bacterium]